MKNKSNKLIIKSKKSIFAYIIVYVLILFLLRLIINLFGYEFYSQVYYLSAFIILIIILINITKKIIKCEDYNIVEKIIYPFTYGILQIIIYTIFIYASFMTLDIKSETIVSVGNTEYVRKLDGVIHLKTIYYKYCGFLIRENKKIESNLEIE